MLKNKDYIDEEAALEVLKNKKKHPLRHLPFVQKFDYGTNHEGYWNYHHMIKQFEDTIGVLKALFGEMYQFIFFFDHSAGHNKKRPNCFNSNTMKKFFKANKM